MPLTPQGSRPQPVSTEGFSSRPRPLVLGTAGHVDHGKTTLIKWLTGIDTDRLPEEQERGITIELGFAYLDLGGQRLAVVDVPGHERFIRAMAAGATGIDLVLLVVAADEGVMPQTREHLAICELLGVQTGLVVLTKIDLVEQDWLELVREDVAQALEGTFLAGAPIVGFSAVDQARRAQGLAEVREALIGVVERLRGSSVQSDPLCPAPAQFRLPLDRVFSVQGFGTVATGTCISGELHEGEGVEVLPSGCRARVRGMQAHGQAVDRVGQGQRVALNLQGVERSSFERGETIVRAGELSASSMFDARVELLPHVERPVGLESRLLLHHGTAMVEATLLLLDGEELSPGGTALAQLRLARPLVVLPGDRFLLRGFARHAQHGTTVGGGRVLVSHPQRHRRREREQAAAGLRAVEAGGAAALLEEVLRQAGPAGLGRNELAAELGAAPAWLTTLLAPLATAGRVHDVSGDGGLWVHADVLERVAARAEQVLAEFHRKQPRRSGLEREELASRLPELAPSRSGRQLLQRLVEQGRLAQQGTLLRLPGFAPRRDEQGERRKEELVRLLAAAGVAPPHGEELARPLGLTVAETEELLSELVEDGRVARVREDLYLEVGVLAALQDRLVSYLEQHGEISTGDFKDLVGTSRRFAIPLAEYFDKTKITLRVGEVRRLRKG